MTTISATPACIRGILLLAVLMITSEGTPYSAKEQCWEECTHEIAGRCFLWKQRCELIPQAPKMPVTGMEDDDELFQRAPLPRQTPPEDGALDPGRY
jgi:hypothetical protein